MANNAYNQHTPTESPNMTANYIANTIWQQLGANKFGAMTGVKNMVYGPDSLTVKCGSGWFLFVKLCADDTYRVECFKLRAGKQVAHKIREGVYADKLRATFTEFTGLETSL